MAKTVFTYLVVSKTLPKGSFIFDILAMTNFEV